MISEADKSVMFDESGNPVPVNRVRRKLRGQAKAMFSGFKGANDDKLADWVLQPIEINQILRNDLQKLRARSRDLAINDDTAKRFLALLKQNVLGHRGIRLQAKNKQRNGKADKKWNAEIEREWKSFGKKRRHRGMSSAPSACGQMTLRQIQWLVLLSRAVDGECFIQILRGYPHNKHRFAVRFLNPDLLDSGFCRDAKEGSNRVEMGIELDEFDRPVAYHFSQGVNHRKNSKRLEIPADQIIHIYRREFVGQLRGFPDFAGVMHKTKMLNGVHEAVVVGWRVAAAKMGFFVSKDEEDFKDPDDDPDDPTEVPRAAPDSAFDATPGSFDYIDDATDFKSFDVEYPTSSYAEGHSCFMQQISNGLNVSSPTLSNDYSKVNYSSLRQALLEDREGWRCVQSEMTDDFGQPLFDMWYDWTVRVTGLIQITEAKQRLEPVLEWQPRGWEWVDPWKEFQAQRGAVQERFRTRQSVMSDNSGSDFAETIETIADEESLLEEHGLTPAAVTTEPIEQPETDDDE